MALTREQILGKTVIGALEICNDDNEVVEVVEIVGQVMDINEEQGILICNHDTKKAIGLPLNFNAFKTAEKGFYTMKSGARIKNPDLTCIMRIIKN